MILCVRHIFVVLGNFSSDSQLETSHKQNHQILMLEGNSGCLTLGPATCPCSTIAWFGSMEPVRPKKKIFTKCEKWHSTVWAYNIIQSNSENLFILLYLKVKAIFDSSLTHGLYSPLNSPGQKTGVGSLSLLQGIFPTRGLNQSFPPCRWILYQLRHKGSPRILDWVAYPFSIRSSQPSNQTRVSCIARRFFINWAIREALVFLFVCICVLVAQSCLLFATPKTIARQDSLSMEFSRQEYWSGLLFPPSGALPDPWI